GEHSRLRTGQARAREEHRRGDSQCRRQTGEHGRARLADAAGFDLRDRRAGDPDALGELRLGQVELFPRGTSGEPEGRSLARGGHVRKISPGKRRTVTWPYVSILTECRRLRTCSRPPPITSAWLARTQLRTPRRPSSGWSVWRSSSGTSCGAARRMLETVQAIAAIVLIDLALSGDNALVIGVVAR